MIRYLKTLRTDGYAIQTIERRRSAIRDLFLRWEKEPPTMTFAVQSAMREIRHGIPKRKVLTASIRDQDVKRMKAICDDSPRGLRNRLVITLLYDCQFERDHVSTLKTRDVAGLEPSVRALALTWLKAANISGGPLLRPIEKGGRIMDGALSAHSVNQIVKLLAAKIGLSKAVVSTRSLRKGQAASSSTAR